MVREFKLINEKGQEYSLMDINNYCLLTEPSGLGLSYETEYEQLGNTFVTNLRKMEQGKISGIVNSKSYDNFKNFIDFIEKSEALKFAYSIPYEDGEKEFYKNININSLEKTEKQENGIISEPITFDCLSLWYEENRTVYTMKPQSDEIRWDFSWDSKFADYNTRSLEYINKGHVEAPILVSIDGHIINPILSLYVEGKLMQKVKFNVEIDEYEKLLYGTKENEFYINKQKTDGTQESLFNLDVIDFANDNVIRLPKNKSCELKMTCDEGEILKAEITILPQYKFV